MDGFSEDRCRICGRHIGWGLEELHLGVCDAHDLDEDDLDDKDDDDEEEETAPWP